MKYIIALTLVITASSAFSKNLNRIIELDETSKTRLALYLDSGEIVDILRSNKTAISQAKDAFRTKDFLRVTKRTFNKNTPDLALELEIVAKGVPFTPEIAPPSTNKNLYTREAYNRLRFRTLNPIEKSEISILPTYEVAQEVMDTMNGATHDDSQCYNRAHLWTYEALINNNVNLGKVWIFFTKKYIREIGHKWWFHIAPYTVVGEDKFKYILDRGFTMVPYTLENWKNIFIKNKADCTVVTDYNDYDRNQNAAYCYLIYSSQYYWQPWQLERLSERRVRFWGYKESELKVAYKDGLISWNRRIPKLDPSIHTGLRFPTIDGSLGEDSDTDRPSGDANGVPYVRVSYQRGDDIIDNSFRTGEVERLIGANRIVMDYDNSSDEAILDVRVIGKRIRSGTLFDLREGQEVVVAGVRPGNIKRLYSNGIFYVDFDNASDHHVRYSDDIAGEVRSFQGFSRRVRVIDQNGNPGKVKRVFSNGKVYVDYDSRRVRDTIVDYTFLKRR